jgi:hypothetical protein
VRTGNADLSLLSLAGAAIPTALRKAEKAYGDSGRAGRGEVGEMIGLSVGDNEPQDQVD